MNTSEKFLLYMGCAVFSILILTRILHYIESKDMSPFVMFGWIPIIRAYQQYTKRLQLRNAELETLLALPSAPAA